MNLQLAGYALSQLANRIGGEIRSTGTDFKFDDVSIHYVNPEYMQPSYPSIIIVPLAEKAWQDILKLPPNSLDHCLASQTVPSDVRVPFSDPVPILFWGTGYEDGSKPFVERRHDGTVVFYADILAATFFMLSRWEETVVPTRDLHGRFPATASVAFRQGFLDRPIVDEYALILQAWIKTLLPSWTLRPPRFSIKLSHDIDIVSQFPSLYRAVRVLAGDLLKRRSPRQASQTLRSLVASRAKPDQDPFLQGIHELASLSDQHGLKSAFYFMSAEPGTFDSGYRATKPLRRCIDELRKRGHEIGFHPGYRTPEDPERFAAEKVRMDKLLGESTYGGRQHYLRFLTPDTWRLWEQMGLTYDSTLSYADHEGFRCGTCHPYQPYDVKQDRPLDVLEIPLIVMDGTLKQYRGLTPDEGEDRILTLAQRCKEVNGIFTLLWHNSSLQDEWEPWAAIYRRVLPLLAAMENPTKEHRKSDS